MPALVTALKMEVDRDRAPGRFVLTGAADVLRVPAIQDSLAGRLEVIRLHPLAQGEIATRLSGGAASDPRPDFLDTLFRRGFRTRGRSGWERSCANASLPEDTRQPSRDRRAAGVPIGIVTSWTQTQRDVRDLARIHKIDALPRLLSLSAAQTANLFNVSELAAPFQISRPTIQDYVVLLERVFLLERLSPWHSNRLSRLVKTPKLHLGDTGLACALLGVDAADLATDRGLLGQLLETFVFQELRRQASWHEDFFTFFTTATGTKRRWTSSSSAAPGRLRAWRSRPGLP